MISRKSIIFHVFSIDYFSNAPSLESLNVGKPDGMGDAGFSEIFVEYEEEIAETHVDGAEVGEAGVGGRGGVG